MIKRIQVTNRSAENDIAYIAVDHITLVAQIEGRTYIRVVGSDNAIPVDESVDEILQRIDEV